MFLGEVLLLPSDRALVPGRRIVGAAVRVRSVAFVGQLRLGGASPIVVRRDRGPGVFVRPDAAHGMWLEFREAQK